MRVKPLPSLMPADAARFWGHVDVRAANECWEWKASRDRPPALPYGRFKIAGRTVKAHRVAYLLVHGQEPLPVARHRCDNPPCCNPNHVISGSVRDNTADRYARGRDRHQVGAAHHSASLTWEQVELIRARRGDGERLRVLAIELGVCEATVCNAARGVSYRTQEYVPRSQRG